MAKTITVINADKQHSYEILEELEHGYLVSERIDYWQKAHHVLYVKKTDVVVDEV